MAGNDWINSYVEAILDVQGPAIEDSRSTSTSSSSSSSLLLRERGNFNPTKYFVEEVVTGFDETDLHRSWLKASATKGPQERNTRLENMCWRIWNLARKKKQIVSGEAQRSTKCLLEHERSQTDATEDMLEDLSEEEKGGPASGEGRNKHKMPRISSRDVLDAWADQQKDKKLYIVLISLHGLVRGYNMELGRDSDTGGQVKYVVELARALATMPGIYRVDLLTRQICSPDVDSSYGEKSEMLTLGTSDQQLETGENSGAYIIRIPFGPSDKYISKELLWPYIPEFVDGALNHILIMARILGEEVGGGQLVWPYVIHGHYADAGDASSLLSGALNVPMVFTGHSLGRNKLEQLLKQGRQTLDEINATYKISRRIEAEELCLDASELIITSTRQEIKEQWGLYDGFDLELERVLRARAKRNVSSHGRFMPRMVVIAPGMEFHLDGHDALDADGDTDVNVETPSADPPIWTEIMRFFTNPRKPMILALARPDPKKNLTTLIKAFGECRPLRELANLTLVMGNRDDIDEMSGGNAAVLTTILKLIDKYDLYGQVAYPKHHKQSDVPEIYRLAAKTKGVFINPALVEPFGLTLIEAAAYGLPIVATKNGGPVDIHKVLDNGLLVDPHDPSAIANALLKLLADKQLWMKCRQNGLKNIHLFSWPEHCKTYLSRIALCRLRHPRWRDINDIDNNTDSDSQGDSLRDIQDLSLKISLGNGSIETSNDLEESLTNEKTPVEKAEASVGKIDRNIVKHKATTENAVGTANKFPCLKRRSQIFIIAVDSYSMEDKGAKFLLVIKEVMKSLQAVTMFGSIGVVLSTSLTFPEAHSLLSAGGINILDFDAFICSSGSAIYYSTPESVDGYTKSGDSPFISDQDYASHIDYRWGRNGIHRTMVRWANSISKDGKRDAIIFEEQRCNEHCLAFQINDTSAVPTVEKLRRELRMQAIRCHVVYCERGFKLHVIPLFASRSQALRYLFTRWGIEVNKMVVLVGETGDTDYEELLGGLHKTLILKSAVDSGCDKLLRGSGSYGIGDVVPLESNSIVSTGDGYDLSDIILSLKKLGIVAE